MPVPAVGPDDPAWRRFLYWLWGIGVLVIIGYVTYWFSGSFAWVVDELIGERFLTRNSIEAVWVSRVLLFALLMFAVAAPLQNILFSKSSASAGYGWRRVKGAVFDVTVVAVLWGLPVVALFQWGEDSPMGLRSQFWGPVVYWLSEATIPVWILSLGAYAFWRWPVFGWVGRTTAPVRQWWRRREFGAGGSAGFGGLFEEFAARYRRGGVLLGSSLYFSPRGGKGFKIGVQDDRHMLTIASNRSGKGRSAIIPNLILWPHSALVIDPKGTNAAVTAQRRGKGGGRVTDFLGQDVFVVDPFEIVEGIERSSFNPLAAIDINGLTVTEDIAMLADALVMPEQGKGSEYFVAGAKTIIGGVVAHLLTQEYETVPSLLDVRRALTGSVDELDDLFGTMAGKETVGAGSLARAAASLMESAGVNERGAHFNTVSANMNWLDSMAMSKILGRSDFDLADLKKGNMTIYVVLPPDLLEEHKRFMRLFVNLAIRTMARGKRSEKPVLFVLDEFFSLGTMTLLEKAAGLLAGYNVKLWPIVQNLTQLMELYPKNWETFFSNAGAVQVFAVNDLKTEEHLIRMLGKAVRDVEVGGRLQRVVAQLRETEEMEEELARETGREIIFRSGAPPLLLRRTDYDRTFRKDRYAPDPDHPGS